MSATLLLVDDDRAFSALAGAALTREGFQVTVAHSLHEARRATVADEFELVVLDRRLPDGDGLDWLKEFSPAHPRALVLLVTAHGDIASAVAAMRAGATDYLTKPVELADLVARVRRAADARSLRERLERAEGQLAQRHRLIAPVSAAMRAVVATAEKVAKASARSPVLLLGETGSGKEVLAWHVHRSGAGPDAPFVHVNCAALPDSIAESELFGHEKGAFTDARQARRGLVELAHGGTLFLDEVGELSAPVQAKLLTYLDSGEFRRLGGQALSQSTARVVAATHRDLEAAVREGRFREDLWFRLSVFKLAVPPLRERKEDLLPLAEGLLARLAVDLKRPPMTLSPEACERLRRYDFPGNVRELRNVLERAAVLEGGPALTLANLEVSGRGGQVGQFIVADGLPPLEEVERRYARHVLERLGGRRMDAAKALGISYPTFLKRLGEEE